MKCAMRAATALLLCGPLLKDDDLVLLRRELPSGRIIDIDTNDFDMLNDGIGIVHLNMNNGDNRIENLMWVKESQARKMLMPTASTTPPTPSRSGKPSTEESLTLVALRTPLCRSCTKSTS